MKLKTWGAVFATFLLVVPFSALAIEEAPPTPTPTPSQSGSAGGGGLIYCSGPMAPGWNASLPGGGCSRGGSVLGTSTVASSVSAQACTPDITSHMHITWNNDPEQVRKLQAFLNKELGLSHPISGVFDQKTFEAVKAFQLKYTKEVLSPWSITEPTGFVYKTTLAQIRALECK